MIELMIVIAVMAILIGIALPYFKGMQDEGNVAKAAGELRTLAIAIESYYIHNDQEYPSQSTSREYDWQDPIVAAIPKIVGTELADPFDSAPYRYVTSDTSGSGYYVVFSVGPDGTANILTITDEGVIAPTGSDDIYFTNAETGVGGY